MLWVGHTQQLAQELRQALQTQESLNRLLVRSRRLYEQGVDINRLRQYVQRWLIWLHSGLRGKSVNKGALTGFGFGAVVCSLSFCFRMPFILAYYS